MLRPDTLIAMEAMIEGIAFEQAEELDRQREVEEVGKPEIFGETDRIGRALPGLEARQRLIMRRGPWISIRRSARRRDRIAPVGNRRAEPLRTGDRLAHQLSQRLRQVRAGRRLKFAVGKPRNDMAQRQV